MIGKMSPRGKCKGTWLEGGGEREGWKRWSEAAIRSSCRTWTEREGSTGLARGVQVSLGQVRGERLNGALSYLWSL